jgi:predicted acyl esterase
MNALSRMLALTALALAVSAPFATLPREAAAAKPAVTRNASYVTTRDGVQLYYKDWGPRNGPVVTFSHGWPLSSDSWEAQMQFLADQRASASSRMTAAATAAPASPGTATTWTTTPTTWPPSSRHWISGR